MDKTIIRNFLASQTLMTVASVGADGTPRASVVEYAETPELKIIFDTFSHFRKYKDLGANPNVALVFDDRGSTTVQYEGKAREFYPDEAPKYLDTYLRKLPSAQKFVGMPETRWFVVTPVWIRYTRVDVVPWEVREVVFD